MDPVWNNGLLEFFKDSLVNHYTSENTNGHIETIAGTEISRIGGVDVDKYDEFKTELE